MPPKVKITKEALLECAYRIAEQEGIASVTSRAVAKMAGCSIQPVFSHFPTMEDLRQATFDYVCQKFVAEVMSNEDDPHFLSRTVQWTVDLARNRPHLYRLLYLSGGLYGRSMAEAMMSYESNRRMIQKMVAMYDLAPAKCEDILVRSCLFLAGICTMICENNIPFSDEQVSDFMVRTVTEMVQGAKRETL